LRTQSSNDDIALPQVQGGIFDARLQRPGVVLLAFLQTVPDTADTQSRRQAAFLSSMARQFGPGGLVVAAIDASALVNGRPPEHGALVNASYDWHLTFPLLEDAGNRIARGFAITEVPTVVMLAPGGTVTRRWQGLVLPAVLAENIEALQ
jgi:hypothetical protein